MRIGVDGDGRRIAGTVTIGQILFGLDSGSDLGINCMELGIYLYIEFDRRLL